MIKVVLEERNGFMRPGQRYNRNKSNYFWVGLTVFLAILLAVSLYYVEKQSQSKKMELIQAQKAYQEDQEASIEKLSLLDTSLNWNSTDFIDYQDVINGNATGTVLLTPDYFLNNAIFNTSVLTNSSMVTVKLSGSFMLSETDVLVLSFAAHSESGVAALIVAMKCGEDIVENTLYLAPDEQIYCIPFAGISSIDEISFSTVDNSKNSDLTLSNIYLTNYKDNYSINQLATGVYQTNDIHVVSLYNSDKVIPDGQQVLVKDDCVFALSPERSALIVYKNVNGEYTEISRIEGLGNVRDMAFNSDRSGIIITSRMSGMFIADISDINDIKLASRRDTLELSTGITVNNNYAFIADRRKGIEIWDVRDLYNPEYIGGIKSEDTENSQYEYQDCEVDGNFLYVGIYGEKKVKIYDISNINDPVSVADLELDGRGQGMDVVNGILYVSTALASRDLLTNVKEPIPYASGAGNGLELWDVSDPSNPTRLSIKKFEGRNSENSRDVWDVEVIGDCAYVSNMYSGVWLVDISDPIKPVITDNYRIVLYQGDEDYSHFDNLKFALPFNADEESRAAAYHVAVENGRMYIATADAGIYEVESDSFKKNISDSNPYNLTEEVDAETVLQLRGYSVEYADIEGCVWAVAKGVDYLYAACGYKGIAVLDDDMTVLQYVETSGPARDVKICGEHLFVAEMENGTSIYEINGAGLTLVSNCPVSYRTEAAVGLQLTEHGNYIFVHTSELGFDIWNIQDILHPQEISTDGYNPGRMDLESFCNGLVAGKYVGVIGRDHEYWFYEDESGNLNVLPEMESKHYSEVSGSTAVGDYCFAPAYIKSYYYYSPLDIDGVQKVTVEGASFVGMCTSNGSILVVTRHSSGAVGIFDVSNIADIRLITSGSTDFTIGTAYFDRETIYISNYHNGLIRIIRE